MARASQQGFNVSDKMSFMMMCHMVRWRDVKSCTTNPRYDLANERALGTRRGVPYLGIHTYVSFSLRERIPTNRPIQ